MDSNLKEVICFESYWVSPIPTGSMLMATLQHFADGHVSDGLYHKYMLFTHFYLMERKRRSLVCIACKHRIS